MKYRAEIDGLRAFAVLPVILFHAGFEWISGGFIGVDIFFVISGYLITTIIISEMAESKFSIVNFYERRARRILPALFFVMAICLPFAWFWLTPNDLKDFGQSLIAVSTFSSNILFWSESGYFDTAAELKPMLHTWSLAVEEQYYILFPIFLMLIWHKGIKLIIVFLTIFFLISLGAAQWGAYNSPSATFYLLPTRGWELLIGVFLALFLKYNNYPQSTFLNQVLSILGFIMISYSILAFDKNTPFPSLYTLIPTMGTGLLILSAVPKTFIHKLLTTKPIVWIGLISYSAYLWHQPILAFARHRLVGETLEILVVILCITSSFAMAWFSWAFIENPIRNKKKISRKAIFKGSFIGMIFFIIFGSFLVYTNGNMIFLTETQKKIYQVFYNPADYVDERHVKLTLSNFDTTNKKHDILVIGDSFSKDLVNAAFEVGLDSSMEFSTFYIPGVCGVLFVESSKNQKLLDTACSKENSFHNEKLLKLMKNADEIWVTSNWNDYSSSFINESVLNIKEINKNVKIFGSKYFGTVSANHFKHTDQKSWIKPISSSQRDLRQLEKLISLNKKLQREVINANGLFIDTQKLICNNDVYNCVNYVDGNIISYDGEHLTPFGARIFGERVLSEYRSIR